MMSKSKWRRYGIWKLKNQLGFLENTEEGVYEVRDLEGKFICSFIGEYQLRHYEGKEFDVIQLDKEDYMKQLRIRIEEIETL